MKINHIAKLTSIVSIIIGLGNTLSAAVGSDHSDGTLTLPTFHVYASYTEGSAESSAVEAYDWKFQKSIDPDAEPVPVNVVLPGEELQQVYTPAISVSLFKS